MLKIKKKDWIEIAIHLAFWTAVFYTLGSLTGSIFKLQVKHNGGVMAMDGRQNLSPYSYLTIIFLMILFYGNIFWIFKKALQFKKILSRLAVSIAWFGFAFAANYFIIGSLLKSPNPQKSPFLPFIDHPVEQDPFTQVNEALLVVNSWQHMQFTMLLIFLLVLGLSVAYFFLKEWARNELVRNQLAADQYSTEIKFLKSQINPHFLFNTLNNLFSMAQEKGNDELAESISTLSGMMRYMLYESNEQIVPLKKEIEYLENSILLNKLRYADEEAKVIFNYPENSEGIFIAPMLFIPFVENAFKYGVIIGKPSQIFISVSTSDKQLIFNCRNTIYNTRKMEDEKKGIGLENVRRRLELVYPRKHELFIKNNDGNYSVELKINLE